ncbi:MAG: hypothetical protein ABJM29_16205 [Rhizobiaceae bacterium]
MPTLWLFDIESHEQRYTSEWQKFLPLQLNKAMASHGKNQWKLEVVSGGQTSGTVSAGAFMNFAETNFYKAEQVANFSRRVAAGTVKRGDRLLFTDAWHPGVIHCRYMSDLLGLSLKIHSMWHAGSYDRHDFLGRTVTDKKWSFNFEKSVFHASDWNYFATKFHRDLFLNSLKPGSDHKAKVVGWPMEYLPQLLSKYAALKKHKIILFPHRMAPEKQPEIFAYLSSMLPEYRLVFAQDRTRTKAEYHALIGQAVAVFSANKQETLGIGVYEGMLLGAIPVVPTRLSYKEICRAWCYPGSWTRNLDSTKEYHNELTAHIRSAIDVRNPNQIATLAKRVGQKFFDGSALYAQVLR